MSRSDRARAWVTDIPWVIAKMVAGCIFLEEFPNMVKGKVMSKDREFWLAKETLNIFPAFEEHFEPTDKEASTLSNDLIQRIRHCAPRNSPILKGGKDELSTFRDREEWYDLWNYIKPSCEMGVEVSTEAIRDILRMGLIRDARGLTGVYIIISRLDSSVIRIGVGGTGKKNDIVDRILSHGLTWAPHTIFVTQGKEAAENLEKQVKLLGDTELGMDRMKSPYSKSKNDPNSCWELPPGVTIESLSELVFEKCSNFFNRRLMVERI